MAKNNLKFIFLFFLISYFNIYAIFPLNLFKTYDMNLRYGFESWKNEKFEVAALVEGALTIKGRNPDSDKVNILQIWNKDQDALTMIRGFDINSEIGQLASKLNDVNDNGKRGHFVPTADLQAIGYSFFAQCFLPYNFKINAFLPIYSMKLNNVNFQDLTENNNLQDRLVRENLTNNFSALVKKLGGLNLSGWEKSGLGDLITLVEWENNFPQNKPLLKNVYLYVNAGFSIPTGVKQNEDQLFSIPFGNDGSWGLLFGSGIHLNWWNCIKFGVDAEFLQLFGTTKCRRIKTDKDQTDLLLLAKAKTFKEIGFNQKFNIFIEANHFFKGFSFRTAYEYLKRGEDKLWLFDNQFSNSIANSAESLQNWTIHQFIFFLNYDFYRDLDCSNAVPRVSLFYKLPFNGSRSVTASTLGLSLSIGF